MPFQEQPAKGPGKDITNVIKIQHMATKMKDEILESKIIKKKKLFVEVLSNIVVFNVSDETFFIK